MTKIRTFRRYTEDLSGQKCMVSDLKYTGSRAKATRRTFPPLPYDSPKSEAPAMHMLKSTDTAMMTDPTAPPKMPNKIKYRRPHESPNRARTGQIGRAHV